MRIWLHIGPAEVGARRLQEVLAIKRERLRRMGVLVPGTGGTAEASWLCHAAKEEDPERAASEAVSAELAREVETHRPEALILSCASLGASLHRRAELDRLKAMLTPLSQDIRILAYVDDPARLLARAYAAQVMAGITRRPGISYAVLTPNMQGYEGARAASASEVASSASVSACFSEATERE